MHTGSPDGTPDRVPGVGSASRRFRRSHSRILAVGLILSGVVHLGLFRLASLIGDRAPASALVPTEPRLVVLPPEETAADPPPRVRVPPPRAEIFRPATPVPAAEVGAEAPRFTPHDVPPKLVNADEVQKVLETRIRGRLEPGASETMVVLWLYIDRSGTVRRLQVRRSSGRAELDILAQQVADDMRFRPALHQGRTVAVWVTQPIRFRPEAVTGTF